MNGRSSQPTEVASRRLWLASPIVAVVLGVLTVLLVVVDVPLEAEIHTLSAVNSLELVFVLPFTLVGTVVARREPRNPMGWLLLLIALVVVLTGDASDYTVFVYYFGHRGWPLGQLAVLFDAGVIAGLALLPLAIMLFPDGQLGPRWKWLFRGYVVLYAVLLTAVERHAVVALGRRLPVWSGGGVVGANHSDALAEHVVVALLVVFCIASVARQLLSYRTSTGVRRQQLKWLGAGGATCIASLVFLLTGLANNAPTAVWVLLILGWAALPASIGVGILKYRLYEIDRLISRTLSYALLTASLVGVFIGLIALTTNTLAFSGRVGVAASTLAAAALFNPLRKRIQRLVDRRFNRARYNAEATVAAFTARLRDAVEIDAIRADLLDTVNRAVQPTHASVWIKPLARA